MNGHALLTLLGLTLLNSLWQGALVGLGLAGLLRVLRRPESRYGAACAALLLTLAAPLTGVWSPTPPNMNFTAFSRASQGAPAEAPVTAPNAATAPEKAAGEGEKVQVSEPLAVDSVLGSPSPSAVNHVFPGAALGLEPLLPWLSLFWALGVLLLSLRLGFSLHLTRRYRTRGVVPVPRDIEEKMNALARRLGFRSPIRLLQTRLLDTPAAVGMLKPVILLPVSVVSGLTAAQLELVLAHELAHIRRRDPLVNFVQTLAETLLFYHPVVWWASRVVREEREHLCDDLALHVTGQSGLAFAQMLGKLEASRAPHLSTAATGHLLPRVRRLLGLKVAPPAPHWSASVLGFTLGVFSVLVLSLGYAQVVAPPQRVSDAPNVFSTDIAVDPTNPERLAVAVDRASEGECREYLCTPFSLLYTSTDGGATWLEGAPYGTLVAGSQSSVAFAPDGALYASGVLVSNTISRTAFVNRADAGLVMGRFGGGRKLLTKASTAPVFAADPQRRTLYMTYLSYAEDGGDVFTSEVLLRRSSEGVLSEPVRVFGSDETVSTGSEAGKVFLSDPQALVGKGGAVIVTAEGTVVMNEVAADSSALWLAVSRDGGESFSAPREVARGAAFETAASADGTLFVLERSLENALTLLTSSDNGATWQTFTVQQDVPTLASFYKSFSLGVSPEGVIDVAYYSSRSDNPACFGTYRGQTEVLIDPCTYDVLYRASRDGGVTFSAPAKLNLLPVTGRDFVRSDGVSFVGDGVALASSDAQALVSWVGSFEKGTQAFLTRVPR